MKIIIVLLAALLSFNVNAAPQSAQDFSRWMVHYYLNPEPASIAPPLKYAFESHLIDDVKKSGPRYSDLLQGR